MPVIQNFLVICEGCLWLQTDAVAAAATCRSAGSNEWWPIATLWAGPVAYSSLAYDPAGDQLVVAYERGTADKPRKIDECGPGSITTYISFASVALPGG